LSSISLFGNKLQTITADNEIVGEATCRPPFFMMGGAMRAAGCLPYNFLSFTYFSISVFLPTRLNVIVSL
jgi:hypothetical protein